MKTSLGAPALFAASILAAIMPHGPDPSNSRPLTPSCATDPYFRKAEWLRVSRWPLSFETRLARFFVMAGLDPAIHVLLAPPKAWMPGTRPGMTSFLTNNVSHQRSVKSPFPGT